MIKQAERHFYQIDRLFQNSKNKFDLTIIIDLEELQQVALKFEENLAVFLKNTIYKPTIEELKLIELKKEAINEFYKTEYIKRMHSVDFKRGSFTKIKDSLFKDLFYKLVYAKLNLEYLYKINGTNNDNIKILQDLNAFYKGDVETVIKSIEANQNSSILVRRFLKNTNSKNLNIILNYDEEIIDNDLELILNSMDANIEKTQQKRKY